MTSQIPENQTGIIIANAIPKDYYRAQGTGQSQHQIHAGSFHDAMRKARVERGNLLFYSSILPSIAREIPLEEGIKQVPHGSELRAIHAAAHVDREQGETRGTAAIIYGFLYEKKRKNQKHSGGLVCEYNGPLTQKEAIQNLKACIKDLYTQPDPEGNCLSDKYTLRLEPELAQTVEPEKRYGTAFVALAFVNFFIPIIEQNIFPADLEAILANTNSRGF